MGQAPFGQRMHWVRPTCDQPEGNTIFKELGGRTESKFDSQLMTKVFGPTSPQTPKAARGAPKPPPGISVLDTSRAHMLGIKLNTLRLPTTTLCSAVSTLDIGNASLRLEDLESLAEAMPTVEESNQLQAYSGAPETLRDVEQRLLPLCTLKPARLRVMRISLSHVSLHAGLARRCRALQDAAREVRSSEPFRELLHMILQIGNYINHGDAEPAEGTVRGFAIESLHVLASFKKGGVSALHFLCFNTIQVSGAGFLHSLMSSLSHVSDATNERVQVLQSEATQFSNEARFVQLFVEQQPPEAPEREALAGLVAELCREDAELRADLSAAVTSGTDVQAYLSASAAKESLPPLHEFFGHIATFLRQFQTVWREVSAGRGVWRRLSHEVTNEVSMPPARNSLPGARQQAGGSSRGVRQKGLGKPVAVGRARGPSKKLSVVTYLGLDLPRKKPRGGFQRQMSEPDDAFWMGLKRQMSQQAPSLQPLPHFVQNAKSTTVTGEACDQLYSDSDSGSDDLELGEPRKSSSSFGLTLDSPMFIHRRQVSV